MNNLFTVLFALVATTVLGQSNTPKGIGSFKIGITAIHIIDSLKSEFELGNIEKDGSGDIDFFHSDDSFKILELVIDPYNHDNSNPNLLCIENARVFLLRNYALSKITLEELYLTFYKDTLIKLSSQDFSTVDHIQSALEHKYGKGEIKTNGSRLTCISWLGDTLHLSQADTTERWYGSELETICSKNFTFGSECHFIYPHSFTMKNVSLCNQLDALQKKEFPQLYKTEAPAKKHILSDF